MTAFRSATSGLGNRGRELASVAAGLKDRHNVEMTAVCDLWNVNRERAAKAASQAYGRAPRLFQYLEELLASPDVDAVIISTADFQHAPLLRLAAEAGKDAYCEKPMANVLDEAKAARDAVRSRKLIVQIGTQHRSEPYQIAVRDWIARGVLGRVSKVEIVWNYHGPRWRGRPEVQQIREQDTDWRKWLLSKPYRPFDPRAYFEFRLYRDFSSGIADQWMSHGIDMVHYFLDDHFPHSASPMAAFTRGTTAARTPTPFRLFSNTPAVSWSAIPPALATTPTVSPASWEKAAPSSTSAAKAARAGNWWKRRAPTRQSVCPPPAEVHHARRPNLTFHVVVAASC